MKTDLTFRYHADANILLCYAHCDGDDIELDYVWMRDTVGTGYMDILPILQFEDDMYKSWLLEKILEKGREEKAESWRESIH